MNMEKEICKAYITPRYAIIESYYGKFEQDYIIASTTCLQDGALLIEALVDKFKGRTFEFKLKKVDSQYFEGLDDIITVDLFGNIVDYTKYFEGVNCLNGK